MRKLEDLLRSSFYFSRTSSLYLHLVAQSCQNSDYGLRDLVQLLAEMVESMTSSVSED